jgi:hypothetical protein
MLLHTVELPRENKSLFHGRQWVCCLKPSCTADALSSAQTDLCNPAADEDEVSFEHAAGRAPKPWNVPRVSHGLLKIVYSDIIGLTQGVRDFFERVMTTHIAFSRRCSFLRILPSDKISKESTCMCLNFHVKILSQLFKI